MPGRTAGLESSAYFTACIARRACLVAIAFLALESFGACDVLQASNGSIVDYSSVQKIFDQYCISCHSGTGAPADLQLTDFRSYAQIVDVPSSQAGSLKRVKPGNASSSYLFQKINCDMPKSGVRMPSNGKLAPEEQAAIRDWINQGARPANEAPFITSGLSASATSASIGQTLAFSVAANDSNSDALVYQWNFGDGITRTGASVSHAYSVPGVYLASVVVSDGRGGEAADAITITIETGPDLDGDGSPDGIDADDDGDGVPDVIETALGFSPADPASTPASGTAVAAPLAVLSFSSKLDFSRESNDRLAVKGSFEVAGIGAALNQQVVLVVGDVVRAFQLTERGSALDDSAGKFKLRIVKAREGTRSTGSFSVRIDRAILAAGLLNEELESLLLAEKVPQQTQVQFFANGTVYQAAIELLYTRKVARAGAVVLNRN